MEFISTKGMKNEDAPEGQVLVQYLEPGFGGWTVEFAIGYFDNPNDYVNDDEDNIVGDGWKHWSTENEIEVIAYCVLPEKIKTDLTKLTQKEYISKFGYHPNLGNVGN